MEGVGPLRRRPAVVDGAYDGTYVVAGDVSRATEEFVSEDTLVSEGGRSELAGVVVGRSVLE